jgi:alpha-D-ribose 1-methylphosphonate 5-triphosphate synthase subunit PhnG
MIKSSNDVLNLRSAKSAVRIAHWYGSKLSQSTVEDRQDWLKTLSRATLDQLTVLWTELDVTDHFEWLRPAETGTVMVRGRISGVGSPFNMGEMTVTRATVRLDDGTVGFGYTAGRAHRKAELIALIDAVLLRNPKLVQKFIVPLAAMLCAEAELSSKKAAATKVNFFTLVRGENQK